MMVELEVELVVLVMLVGLAREAFLIKRYCTKTLSVSFTLKLGGPQRDCTLKTQALP